MPFKVNISGIISTNKNVVGLLKVIRVRNVCSWIKQEFVGYTLFTYINNRIIPEIIIILYK